MGVTGFFTWVKSKGYEPKQVTLKSTDSFLVDAKLLMYKKAARAQAIATLSACQALSVLLSTGD